MDHQQILTLYTWNPGTCFRHPERGTVLTARVKTLHPRVGGEEHVRACRDCVLEMEQDRCVAAGQDGTIYEPGHAGEGWP
jgi:hypothetical protein